ncbi:MAG: hypothetical protein PHG25_02035 [Candidatus Pacebacteria bacterium]|nr:hypothetical protein [Candidatus Paceibacterota bacterium]
MNIPITYRGGSKEAQPHITQAIEALPSHWSEAVPPRTSIEIVSRERLPHVENTWGKTSTVPRFWFVKMVSTEQFQPIRICICLQKMPDKEYARLFKRDILTGILLSTFTQKHIYNTVKETLDEWVPMRYQMGAVVAEDLASLILDPEANPRLERFDKELTKKLRELIAAT